MTDVAAVAQLSEADLHRLFGARTARAFEEGEVTEDQRRAIYELTKMGPTAFNSQPLRIVWVDSPAAREKLMPHLMPGNRPKTESAPAVAILAMDETWHHKFASFNPVHPEKGDIFLTNAQLAEQVGRDNVFIQVGYFVMAVRAVGLDAGPMTGFDAAGLDADLLAGTGLKSVVVVNVGRGQAATHERAPRYSHEDATLSL